MVICLCCVDCYRLQRKQFYCVIISFVFISLSIQILQVSTNEADSNANYLSYGGGYWTNYNNKPYTRVYSYIIGMILGCSYFTFKYGEDKKSNIVIQNSKINNILIDLKSNRATGLLFVVLGCLMQMIVNLGLHFINNNANKINFYVNLLYLLSSRPMFIIGFSLIIMPILVGNPLT